MKQKAFRITGILIVGLLIFALWYRNHYSMEIAKSYSVNNESEEYQVLIATQGSKFKDLLVSEVIKELKDEPIFFSVIDISLLPDINMVDWNAIVIIHTWEYNEPPPVVSAFLNKNKSTDKLVAFATSGSGEQSVAYVDGISGESIIDDVTKYSSQILKKLKPLISEK